MRKTIVLSGVNMVTGGLLSIFADCLTFAAEKYSQYYDIIALVHDKKLFNVCNVQYIEFPLAKKSWVFRIFYEYIYFYFLSKKIKPYLWLSLHDMTPNVCADRLALYCHNSTPFYPARLKDIRSDWKFYLFCLFYKYLYRINIHKNNYVVVQQQWIRDKFKTMYGLSGVIVARPEVFFTNELIQQLEKAREKIPSVKHLFFYPSLPRVFKNFEIICEASRILLEKGINNYEIILTLSGDENPYAKKLFTKYCSDHHLSFIGLQSREEVYRLFGACDCVLFPSKLESWGLPISEAMLFKKPLILAEYTYAHEASSGYDKVKYFNANDPSELANLMELFIKNKLIFAREPRHIIHSPYAEDWCQLFRYLLDDQRVN